MAEQGDENYPTYITFCDLTPLSNVVYVSPGVTANLGLEPEEMIGHSVYNYLHPDEIVSLRKTAVVNQQKNVLCEVLRVRAAHKDKSEGKDGWVLIDTVVNICQDYWILITRRCDRTAAGSEPWKRSAELVIHMNDRGEIDTNVSHSNTSHHEDTIMQMIYQQLHWESVNAPNEHRACLILNRFTLRLTILYAIASSAVVLQTTPEEMNLHSFYEFVDSDSMSLVRQSIDRLKVNHTIERLQFPWKTLAGEKVNCRFVFMEASDGIVCIAQRM